MWVIENRFAIDQDIAPRQGGMAEVYKAYDLKNSGQHVAIKLFLEGFLDRRIAIEAFARETRSLRDLNSHNHIAKLLDYGTDAETGRKYIALEWLENDLLAYLIKDPIKGWDHFYDSFGRQILDALCFGHSRGIIHRDVKPANVLVTDEGMVRVSDFGISKYKEYYGPHLTLVCYASPPYAPPERDSFQYADSRDVYGFAVLALEAVNTLILDPDVDVETIMGDLDAPDEVIYLLQKAVSANPSERPANVQDLLFQLDGIQARRRSNWKKKFSCSFRLSNTVQSKLEAEGVTGPGYTAGNYISNDLNDTCAINRFRIYQNGQEIITQDQFVFYSSEHRYQVGEEKNCQGRLFVMNVWRDPPSRLEQFREDAWIPELEFTNNTNFDKEKGEQAIRYIFEGLSEYLSNRLVVKAKEKQNAIINKWEKLLSLQREVQISNGDPIQFNSTEIEGNRIHLYTNTPPEQDIIDQSRIIKVNEYREISGIIDHVTSQFITLYCNTFDADEIPQKGILLIDSRAAESALKIQQNALDAMKFDRAVRPDLKHILLNPEQARPPKPCILEMYHQKLDESQKSAVQACVSAEDIILIDGPPGTGKTRFISELILQYLRINPGSRILLSSQTHNAVDNAIEKISVLSKDIGQKVNIVRIGKRTDARISTTVREFLLENAVASWLLDVKKTSQIFLESWAEANGVDRKSIELGLAVAKLRSAKEKLEIKTKDYDSLLEEVKIVVETEKMLREKTDQATELAEIQSSLNILRRDVVEANTTIAEARKEHKTAVSEIEKFGKDGRDLSGFTWQELQEWEHDLLNKDESGIKCRKIIELLEDWYERFGRSIDFFGAFVLQSDIVAATCVSSAGRGLSEVDYDLCIVDEASKATPTEILVPMARSRKWVIVGDPRQLPPFVSTESLNKIALEKHGLNEDDLKDTLLNHLIQGVKASCHYELNYQYRMFKPIGDLVSHCFYNNRLQSLCDEEFHLDKFLALPMPVTWFSTSKEKDCTETKVGNSNKNFCEVNVIKRFLKRLNLAAKDTGMNLSVAVLSGYLSQVNELQRMASELKTEVEYLNIESNTVDAFQGREADVAVYSITRSNKEGRIGFLKEFERLNVALSRGRLGLAIVGDSYFCQEVKGKNPFIDILDYIRNNPKTCTIVEG